MPTIAPMRSIMIGETKVTFLPDGGGIVIPTALYPASSVEGWEQHKELLDEEGKFITTIGGYLIEMKDRKIVVDLGIGPVNIEFPGFGPFFGGRFLESFDKTGVKRDDVTDVIFTHLHLDHCGWTTIEVNGKRQLTFPNARHQVTLTEWAFWHGGDNPAGPHPEFVQKPLEGRIEMFNPGDELAPGLTAVATPGHTPGHVSLFLKAGKERLCIMADILHGAMQLEEPDWSAAFDVDPITARQSRESMYPELTKPNTLAAANHFSNAVFGHIKPTGDGRHRWIPLD